MELDNNNVSISNYFHEERSRTLSRARAFCSKFTERECREKIRTTWRSLGTFSVIRSTIDAEFRISSCFTCSELVHRASCFLLFITLSPIFSSLIIKYRLCGKVTCRSGDEEPRRSKRPIRAGYANLTGNRFPSPSSTGIGARMNRVLG